MAINKPFGDNKRIGAVKNRAQIFNPKNKKWIKIDTNNNRFIDVKSNNTPFKGVRKK